MHCSDATVCQTVCTRSCGLQDCSVDVQWQEEVAQKSDRPELSAAKIVISGMPHILSSG